jgi:hypothetical protein
VLQPNDLDSYYQGRELVPNDMLDDIARAKIVITNYHAFKLRERIELSKATTTFTRSSWRHPLLPPARLRNFSKANPPDGFTRPSRNCAPLPSKRATALSP